MGDSIEKIEKSIRGKKRVLVMLLLAVVFLLSMLTFKMITEDPYIFTIDGQVFSPQVLSLHGSPENPHEGDVIIVGEFVLVLGPPGEYSFKTTTQFDGCLFQIEKNGQSRIVAANVMQTIGKTLQNPLANMTPHAIAGLRGIFLDSWFEGLIEKLKHIDTKFTCLTITDQTASCSKNHLIPLPKGLHYLQIYERISSGIKDYRKLEEQNQLRFFRLRQLSDETFNVQLLAANKELKHLNLVGTSLENTDTFSLFTKLRDLQLGWCKNLESIDFIRYMPGLRRFDFNYTMVRDLIPLDDATNLVFVNADGTPSITVPVTTLPNLSELRVMGTRISNETLKILKTKNPQCEVYHGWGLALRRALVDVTRIQVFTEKLNQDGTTIEKTLLEIENPHEIEEFVNHIAIDEEESGFYCQCRGGPFFKFYKGDKLVVVLGLHHGNSLRWPGGWPGDGQMSQEFADYLIEWLDTRGVKGPKEEIEREQLMFQELDRIWNQWVEATPKSLRPFLSEPITSVTDQDLIGFHETLAQEMPDKKQRILKLFHWYGSGQGLWNGYSGYEDVALRMLLKYKTNDLLKAVHEADLELQHIEGIARLFAGYDYAIYRKVDLQLLPTDLKQRLLQHCLKSNDNTKRRRAKRAFQTEKLNENE